MVRERVRGGEGEREGDESRVWSSWALVLSRNLKKMIDGDENLEIMKKKGEIRLILALCDTSPLFTLFFYFL